MRKRGLVPLREFPDNQKYIYHDTRISNLLWLQGDDYEKVSSSLPTFSGASSSLISPPSLLLARRYLTSVAPIPFEITSHSIRNTAQTVRLTISMTSKKNMPTP